MILAPVFARRYCDVPPAEQAICLANTVRNLLDGTAEPCLRTVLRDCGWTVAEQQLDARSGGNQALMAPCEGSYVFVVDPDPTPSEATRWQHVEPDALRDYLINVRLAHELAHVLFHGFDGRRLKPSTAQEEQFCDMFANALIVAPTGLAAA